MLTKSPDTKIASPLSRKAVLLAVTINAPSFRKLDKLVTDEVNRKHNAKSDAGRYNKLLIEAKRLEDINNAVSRARALHYEMTRPWTDKGLRILPNTLYQKFTDEFRDIKRDFEKAKHEFCKAYPAAIQERKQSLGSLFNESDYPSPQGIESKFQMETRIIPLPDAADFRADLDEDTLNDIKDEIARSSDAALNDAMRSTGDEIIEKVGYMSRRLKEVAGAKEGEKKYFFDSLVENVRDLAKLLPAFNFNNDPELAHIIDRINNELCAEDAADLRKNAKARDQVQKSADEIVAEVERFFA